MGSMLLVAALRDAGHDVTRVRFSRTIDEDDRQSSMFTDRESIVDYRTLRYRPDAWFVSLLYVRQFVDIPALFRQIGLAPLARDRRPDDPLVAFGGQAMIAPEPVAPFADVIALGDGEVTGVRLASYLDLFGREKLMEEVDGVDGFYVPTRDSEPRLRRVEAPLGPPTVIRPGNSERTATIEVARGCKSKCAFCPIGWAGGSYRESPRDAVATAIAENSGRAVNLFAPDYSSVSWAEAADALLASAGCKPAGKDARLDAALRHLRAGGGVKEYNFGVEGVSARLRRAIGKPLDADKIVEVMALLGGGGVTSVRWYLIIGLPGETAEDWRELHDLLDRVAAVYRGRLDITLTHFQSVPHTPLQWEDNRYREDAVAAGSDLRAHLRARWLATGPQWLVSNPKGRELHEHDAWLQRADRRAADYLIALAGNQAKLKDGRWRDVAASAGFDVAADLGALNPSEPTRWAHVDVGQSMSRLISARAAYDRAMVAV